LLLVFAGRMQPDQQRIGDVRIVVVRDIDPVVVIAGGIHALEQAGLCLFLLFIVLFAILFIILFIILWILLRLGTAADCLERLQGAFGRGEVGQLLGHHAAVLLRRRAGHHVQLRRQSLGLLALLADHLQLDFLARFKLGQKVRQLFAS